jgi:hypothetical protein
MFYRTIWLLLDSVHCLVCGSFTKDHNVSETGSVSILSWMGQGRPTQLGLSERASLNHWIQWRAQLSRSTLPHPAEDVDRSSLRNVVVFCKTFTYQTMDRVQKKPNSSVLSSELVNNIDNNDNFKNWVHSYQSTKIIM